MKESLSGFSFKRYSRPTVARSWTLVVEEMEFARQSNGYCFTDLVASEWLPNCVIYTVIVDQRIVINFGA